MPKIVLIEKTGTVKTLNVKDFTDDTIYKKAGIKSSDGFKLQHTWNTEDGIDQSIKLYGKTNGRAGQENKYDFPPPVDETLFFGSCILVGTDPKTGSVVDLEKDDWNEIYEYLFGGFENIGSDDSSDDEEDVETDDELNAIQKTTGTIIKQTKQGYAKDGFIVDDDDSDDEYADVSDNDSDDEDESYDTPPKKIFTKTKKNAGLKNNSRETVGKGFTSNLSSDENKNIHVEINVTNADDCETELSEEPYE